MKTTDFNKTVKSKTIAENIEKLFDVNVDLTKYTREQLEDYRNKLRTRVFQHEGSSKLNDLLTNEEYQKDKAMLELLNTRIKEMLGEQMKKLINTMDQLSEAKKAGKDYDGDGKIESPKDEVWGSRAKAAARAGKPFGKDKKVKEGSKPDFLDLDNDGNKKEPMKKAASDAKVKEDSVDESGLQYHTGVKKHGKEYMKKAAAAGRDGASQQELGALRDKYSKAAKKDKKTNEETVSEKAVSKAQQQAAGIALAAKKKGEAPKKGSASAAMAKMPKKELEKFAKTKHKGLPAKKADESVEEELLPKQKQVAKKILDKDMADAKADRAAKRQAGTMRKESFRKNVAIVNESLARLIVEDEEGKAKAITAASDMVNDFTSWMQRVGNYQTKSMIELADSIRANFGQQEAETFKQAVGPALAATLETLTQQRETISNAVAVLAGEAAPEIPMGQEPMQEPGIDAASPDEMNPADELDAFAASDAAAGAGTTGRDVRESVTSKAARMIAEQHSIIARLAK